MVPAERSNGFTLIELLIGLVISGVLAAVIFQVLLGEGRVARLSNARQEVQQNARAALEVIASELRAVPPGAIRVAARDSIRFFAPRAFGIVCNTITAGEGTIWIAFAPGTAPSSFHGKRSWGVAVADTDDPVKRPDAWLIRAPVAAPGGSGGCIGALGSDGGVEEVGAVASDPFVAPSAAPVAQGSQAFVFEEVKYDLGTSAVTGSSMKWLRRMVGYGSGTATNQQPMAGPIAPTDGLSFEYFDKDGNELLPVPLAPASRLAIASIRITVTMHSTAKFGSGTPQDSRASTTIALRN